MPSNDWNISCAAAASVSMSRIAMVRSRPVLLERAYLVRFAAARHRLAKKSAAVTDWFSLANRMVDQATVRQREGAR